MRALLPDAILLKMKLYCRKCKTKREIINEEEVFATKSYCIIKGKCLGCGGEIHGILEKKKE